MDFVSWFLIALPLSVDCFAAGLAFGVAGLERSRWVAVALVFAAMSALLVAVGIVLGDTLEGQVGTRSMYVAAAALLFMGVRGVVAGLRGGEAPDAGEETVARKRVAVTAIVVTLGNVVVGVYFALLGADARSVALIVGVQVFVATMLAQGLGKRLGAKAGTAAEVFAGLVFVVLGGVVLYQALTTSPLA